MSDKDNLNLLSNYITSFSGKRVSQSEVFHVIEWARKGEAKAFRFLAHSRFFIAYRKYTWGDEEVNELDKYKLSRIVHDGKASPSQIEDWRDMFGLE